MRDRGYASSVVVRHQLPPSAIACHEQIIDYHLMAWFFQERHIPSLYDLYYLYAFYDRNDLYDPYDPYNPYDLYDLSVWYDLYDLYVRYDLLICMICMIKPMFSGWGPYNLHDPPLFSINRLNIYAL